MLSFPVRPIPSSLLQSRQKGKSLSPHFDKPSEAKAETCNVFTGFLKIRKHQEKDLNRNVICNKRRILQESLCIWACEAVVTTLRFLCSFFCFSFFHPSPFPPCLSLCQELIYFAVCGLRANAS